ncbi:S8 family serine peptidase, partial [Vicingaceae bacterium]|nr:S8 family serine peptidase [Vicingaceae bacterium]
MAKINSWPLKIVDKNGNLNMLVGVHGSGEPIYYSEENLGAGITSRANTLYPGGSLGLNLTGLGMTASMWDGGSALTTHELFSGRVTSVDGAASSDHSTHCAGTIIGSDAFQSENAKGMAYQANLNSYDWTNDEAEMAAEAATGTLISSHSYGIPADGSPDYYLGKYDANARDIDNIIFNAPYFLPSCSAGNDRNKGINATGYDILTDKSCNKNALTVAAVNETTNYTGPGSVVMSSFSSWGPTDDGRIKPDISAKGVSTYSAGNVSNSDYGYKSGTSMATPSVAGTLVLLQQHYNNTYSSYMLASTLRGLALHTADEAGNADGPDYEFGWGLINAKRATETINNNGTSSIINELTLSSGQTYTINVTASSLEDLMASIAWTDLQGVVGANTLDDRTPVLINDLDIRITKATSTYMPWKLDPDNPSNPATQSDNIVDNIEKVEVPSPSGSYTITVTHKGTLSSGSQTFSLIVTGITLAPTANDAGLNNILHPTSGGAFCDNPLIPKVVLQNFGLTNLTSANIKYQIDNGPISTHTWSGNLTTGSKDTIVLPFVTPPIASAFTFKAYTSDPNATNDDDFTNDTLTASTQYLVGESIPYIEPFNTGTPSNLTVFDQTNDGFKWLHNNTVDGYNIGGSGSMVMDNFTNDTRGTFDWMLLPTLDLSGSANTKLTFDVAYARYDATYMDSLIVSVNDNCGTSYNTVYHKGNTDLATAPDITTLFTPTATQWRTDTVDLSAYDGKSHVKLAFLNQGGWGQTIYIDNINITQECAPGTSTDIKSACNSLIWLDGVTYTA